MGMPCCRYCEMEAYKHQYSRKVWAHGKKRVKGNKYQITVPNHRPQPRIGSETLLTEPKHQKTFFFSTLVLEAKEQGLDHAFFSLVETPYRYSKF